MKIGLSKILNSWNIKIEDFNGEKVLEHVAQEINKILKEAKQVGNNIIEVGNYIYFNSGGVNRMLGTGFS